MITVRSRELLELKIDGTNVERMEIDVDTSSDLPNATANGHICSVCESELVRDVKNFCLEYAVNCSGFYGKKS